MLSRANLWLGSGMLVLSAVVYLQAQAPPPGPTGAGPARVQAQPAAAPADAIPQRALLNRYCVTCHNERLKTAGVIFDKMDVEHLDVAGDIWEKAILKIRTGVMPPANSPRPDKITLDAFATWLETGLDREAAAHPNPGRPADHRLNQVEYANAIHDLLNLDIDPTAFLPADESDHGFDNVADVLAVSPTLLERYMIAARKISRLAVGDPTQGSSVETFELARGLRQDERMSDELPFGTRGGTVLHHYFPLDGEYSVKVNLGRNYTSSAIRALNTREQIDVLLDGALVQRFSIGGECVGSKDPKCVRTRGTIPTSEYERIADDILNVRFPVKAGMRTLGVAFVRKSDAETEGQGPSLLPPRHTSSTYDAPQMDLASVRLAGPLGDVASGDTPSRRQIFSCRPARAVEEEPCARRILSALVRRAYRRPSTTADVDTLLTFYRSGRTGGTFEHGIQTALERLLVSPHFLFRVERDVAPNQLGAPYRISDLELASRLSFFLWSSIPDDQLLDLAARGQLKDPKILEQQVRRMLADARATQIVQNFGGQWLHVRNMRTVDPDPRAYPDFDDNLRDAFEQETELFLESQMRGDRPLEELLTAKYTFLNERLARFYGVPNVFGTRFRRVPMTDPNRAGLLGQGSLLTVTSYATRTSPVLRGKFMLENIFGAPPPPPPPNVPPFKETAPGEQAPATMRARMEQHRTNPICANCHSRMDPLGFALDNFDGIGKWRTADGTAVIDASGTMPDGAKFANAEEFRAALLTHRSDFVRTFTEKLLTYGLGRGVQYYDMPALRKIIRDAGPDDKWSALILGVVKSEPFQMRKVQAVATN